MFALEPEKRTVVIPVRVKKDGRLTLLYDDGELPPLREGAVGELRLPAHALPEEWAQLLSAHNVVQLLPAEAALWVEVASEKPLDAKFGEHRRQGNIRELKWRGNWLVKVILKAPLCLLWRGTKKPTLLPCRCYIPALDKWADSLNEAYSHISEAFEPHRRSHTGNVFKLCYCDEKGLCPLDALREEKQAECEGFLFQRLRDLREKQRSQRRLL